MKTKIVYCLVSHSRDYYYEQLLISLCSLRKHNPTIPVEVVCDLDTFSTLAGQRSTLFNYNIQVNTVETPKEWDNWERSRYIKTHLRELTRGDYLFIDTDTIICAPLDGVDDIPFDVAAVKDSHLDRPLPRLMSCSHDTELWISKEAQKANVNIAGLWHFNSGVMYVKDTQTAHTLYTKWHEKYEELLAKGVKVDQLPLLLTNNELGNIISPLDPTMNCQISFEEGRKMVASAKIIHYFPGQKKTLLASPWVLNPIKQTGQITPDIQNIIDNPTQFFNKISTIVTDEAAEIALAYDTCPNELHRLLQLMRKYIIFKKKIMIILGR